MTAKWRECRWGELATLEYGKGLRGYEHGAGSFPVYGTNGVIGSHAEPLCPHPGVIIGRKGAYRGVHYSKKPFFVIDTAFYLEPKTDIDLKWAYYQLLTQDINSMDSGSAIPSTSRDAFYNLPVKVPPLPEQKAIASILGALDDKIELNRKMNETLEAMARAIFKSWFVDFDPIPGYGPHKEWQDSPLGKIPKRWRVSPVSDEVRVVGGSTPSTKEPTFWQSGSLCWATPKDLASLSSPILLETERRITEKGLQQISSGLLPKGTVLLSSRAPIGYLAVSEVPVAVNQGFIAMICDQELPNYYVLYWARENMDTIEGRANGTTFLEVSKRNFRPIPIIVPSARVLQVFNQQAEGFHHRVVINLKESRTLAAIRDALLPKLLSGEIRVKDAERFVEAELS
ncbi:MAG: restriction endonuclease subunit S [Nitrospirae bacterium]|nr:restriction endonuclease subunit S [Nitrospirota bacterium]